MILLLTGCALDELRDPVTKIESKTFSIEQAQEFFEKDYSRRITKALPGQKNGKLYPGDFTPLWDKAVYSEKGGKAAYDVSIMTDRRIAATRLTADGAQRVRVYQKLVVTQSTSSGKMTAYIMSLIPNDDQGHFPKSFSSRKSYRGNYSGIVVYTTVDNGALVRVQEYKDGKLHRGANLTSGKDSYLDQCRKAVEILRGIKLSSKRLILTKSGEDWDDSWDDDDYDGWDINDFEDLGYGIYTDGEGNYYIDIDGDGDLDMETLAPGGVTDDMEKEEEEDPWPPTPPDEPGDEPGDDDGWMPGDEDNGNISSDDVQFQQEINRLKEILANRLGHIRFRTFFKLMTPEGGTLASMWLSPMHFYDSELQILIKVNPDLNETQQALVLAHEIMHLILIQISRDAGSEDALRLNNRDLWDAIEKYNNLPATSDKTVNQFNYGHHEYMGYHVDEIEDILREVYPERRKIL